MCKQMDVDEPAVCKAVRAVGILKPQFKPLSQGRVFAEKLEVIGTAFWLKEFAILITCAHVVKNLAFGPIEFTGLLVVGNRGNYRRARISVIDFEHDLAILRPEGRPEEIADEVRKHGLSIGKTYPSVGAVVAYAGFPLGTQLLDATHAPTYAEGVVSAQLRRQGWRKDLQIAGTVAGGFSGAPVVTKSEPAEVVGVLSFSPSKEAASAGIFMAISWEHLRAIAQLSWS